MQRGVHIGFQWNTLAATYALIRRDDDARAAVLNAPAQRFRREAAEHHRMHRADARAGQHGDGGFRDHRQVECHRIAGFHTEAFQHVGRAADAGMQFAVGDLLGGLTGLVRFPENGRLVAALREMAVEAVGGDIQLPALKPANIHVVRAKGAILHPLPRTIPCQQLPGLLRPEMIRVSQRGLVEPLVGRPVDMRRGRCRRRNGEA